MSYVAKVRTGKGPISVTIVKPELVAGASKTFKLKRGSSACGESFERILVREDEAVDFFDEYATRRDLVLGYDESNGNFVFYNPRHRTFRFVHLHDGVYDILSFIEAEFVHVTRK